MSSMRITADFQLPLLDKRGLGGCVIIHLSQIESRFAREIKQNY